MIISDINEFQPSFALFPVNDNTTGYRPISLPMILIIPKRFDATGLSTPNSEVFLTKIDPTTGQSYTVEGIRIKIENVPSEARIVGHQYITPNGNRRFPDKELYAIDIIGETFRSRIINLNKASFYKDDEESITDVSYANAKTGDYFTYRTLSGVEASILYLEGAAYYDFSVDQLTDIVLLPDGYYNVVYETKYYRRNLLNAGSFSQYICIDTLLIDLAFNTFRVNHPGHILSEFKRLTPQPYLTDSSPEVDKTIAFYRSFTTAIQDVYDEQDLLEIVNWIYEAPAELLPYLSYQLGWDIPFFPKSLDRQRRAVLQKTTAFQQLKGSKQAIVSIFNLFGFDILLSNLWYSLDNKRLIRPNEKLPAIYAGQEVVETKVIQFETVVGSVSSDTNDLPGQVIFYRFDTSAREKFLAYYSYPLFRPKKQIDAEDQVVLNDGGDISLYAIKVLKGSASTVVLKSSCVDIYDDPADYAKRWTSDDKKEIYEAIDGSIYPKFLFDILSDKPIRGISSVLLTGQETTEVRIRNQGQSPPFSATQDIIKNLNGYLALNKSSGNTQVYTAIDDYAAIPQDLTSIRYERPKNKLYFSFDSPIDSSESVYMYAAYNKAEYDVPADLVNRRSNYFDLELFLSGTTEQIDPTTLNFAIDFLNKVKALHSLLRTIRQRINLYEDYEVTDLGVGGDVIQRYDTDIGKLQVPPAIHPNFPTGVSECFDYSPENLGYKPEDIALRQIKLDRLAAEFAATERLDRIPFSTTNERIKPNSPQEEPKLIYAPFAQNRVITGSKYLIDDEVVSPDPNTNQFIGQPPDGRANPSYDIKLGLNTKYSELTTNNRSDLLYKMNRQSTSTGKTLITPDNTTDYAYRGRVDDAVLYVQDLGIPEEYRSVMCGLRLGSGVYYTFPFTSKPANFGTRRPAQNSYSNYLVYSGKSPEEGLKYFKNKLASTYFNQPIDEPSYLEFNDLLGKLYRNYPDKNREHTLHYFNNGYSFDPDQRKNQALTRRAISIDKPILHFPGTRFPSLNRLKVNFTSLTYRARPWDDAYSTYCGPKGKCGPIEPSFLNVRQVFDDSGNSSITYDDVAYVIYGNNIEADIENLGVYAGSQNDNIIHKVYMEDATSNPAVTFDQVCDFDSNVDYDGKIIIDTPIFPYVYDGLDFANGYPCVRGIQLVDAMVSYDYLEALEDLGLPVGSTSDIEVLFLLGSGILFENGYRLSCPILNSEYNNDFSLYIDQDGNLQTDYDMLKIDSHMDLSVSLGIRSMGLDGSIPSLLEIW